MLEPHAAIYSSLHVPVSSGLEPTLDGRSSGKNIARSHPAVDAQCEKLEYLQSSPRANPGNTGLATESSSVLKRLHSDGPGVVADKIETVDDEPSPLRRKTQLSQEMLCEPT